MKRVLALCALLVTAMALQACQSVPSTAEGRQELRNDAMAALERFKARDPSMADRLEDCYAYAVFPTVTKGGAGIGGAHGRGVVYERGEVIGYTELTQATVGAQLGGQEYSEIICFEDSLALQTFKDGKLAFAAQASAVAASAGASADADYEEGVLVFTMTRGGLMYEASIGGQQFEFIPANREEAT